MGGWSGRQAAPPQGDLRLVHLRSVSRSLSMKREEHTSKQRGCRGFRPAIVILIAAAILIVSFLVFAMHAVSPIAPVAPY